MTRPLQSAFAALVLLGAASCASPAASTGQASMQDSCINPARIQKQTIVSDEEIRFELAGGEVWANKLKNRCTGLKANGFAWNLHGSLVCSNQQIITVLDSGIPCSLGEFSRVADAA